MDAQRFERIVARIVKDLTAEQCVALEAVLRQVTAAKTGETAVVRRTQAIETRRLCPRCGHDDIVKHGTSLLGRQRFKCRKTAAGGCGRTFNALTGTPLARMRKPEKWTAYARMMGDHKSINAVVKSEIGIAQQTAWRWRHRLLKLPAMMQSDGLKGVVEVDETYFRSSYKGSRGWRDGKPPESRMPRYRGEAATPGLSKEQIPVLTALDRSGGSIECVLSARSDAEIKRALTGRIAPGSVVCSDGFKPYVDLAVKSGSEHRRIMPPKTDWVKKAIGGKPRKKGRMSLGHVNAHHERIKTFVNRWARGVSTRYLPVYLGWLRAIRDPNFQPETLIEASLKSAPI